MDCHDESLARIATRVRQFHNCQQPFRIYHGSTNSTRQSKHSRRNVIDTSGLSKVLKIDTEKKTALVEPNVPMDRLVEATIKYGLIPPVVMEFPGITVGGGFSGTSGESSSIRHGLFDSTINWIEMVLANGDIVTASDSERPDLFYGAAGSLGTLGVVTLLEVRLIQSKQYVELTYYPVSSVAGAIEKFQEATESTGTNYLDGIMFGTDRGIVMAGRLTDTLQDGIKIQRFSRARDPWFYLHAQKLLMQSADSTAVTIPLVDYLFRYDRGAFWVGTYAFKYFVTPFNRITRWALDMFMHTRVMYHALHESGLAQKYIVQDMALPYKTSQQFVEYIDKVFGFYPLWLCPIRHDYQGPLPPITFPTSSDGTKAPKMLLNFGLWGPGPSRRYDFVCANQELERKLHEFSGLKCLYAHAYYTEEEFWSIYDSRRYVALRDKYNASSLPSIYEKVKVNDSQSQSNSSWIFWLIDMFWEIWPLAGLWGVLRATMGGDYLLGR
ncbi:hypothetical protein MMC12_004650 [Toensbergia leucococca]|nr:hypothetical protein [Toensbergia leucococca]